MTSEPALLSVRNLRVTFGGKPAVNGIDIELRRGEMLALVGESGSGKTVTCRSLLGLAPEGAEVLYDSLKCPPLKRMSLVMQNAMTALDPAMPVGKQIAEGNSIKRARAVELISQVGIDRPELRAKQFPSHFSGGMRQRAAVAVSLASQPQVIFADEPTTSLDIEIRMQIMRMLSELRADGERAVLFVTHDLSLVRDFADHVIIMKAGEIVECGGADEIFTNPKSEYTKELLHYSSFNMTVGAHTHGRIHRHDMYYHSHEHSGAHIHAGGENGGGSCGRLAGERREPLITAAKLSKVYPLPRRRTHTVFGDFDIAIEHNEIVGLCGRSGIGKSSLARILAGLEPPSGGELRKAEGLKIQMIFQDNVSAMNPRTTLEQIIGEPLLLRDGKKPERAVILDLMRQCELESELIARRPGQLSGGQQQRAAIARAISVEPQLIIADEPVSSLDVTTCSRIIHLLRDIQQRRGLSILLISHDLPLLNHICDRIVRME
ncbi:MAG: ABC transporter ATP-binding protein [Clostridiales Family XIII bacterium]|nr:ABC transporter ATP-binding protein [Clostridiales Family XIII bacterium]